MSTCMQISAWFSIGISNVTHVLSNEQNIKSKETIMRVKYMNRHSCLSYNIHYKQTNLKQFAIHLFPEVSRNWDDDLHFRPLCF